VHQVSPPPYLLEGGQLGRVLQVPQAGALRRQLGADAFELGVLRRQHQAGVVAQLPQVLQRLKAAEVTGSRS